MVARMGVYYGAAFQGFRGVIQGDPLSPTIFNVVVDSVVRPWISLVIGGEEGKDGGGGGVGFTVPTFNTRMTAW